MTAIENRIIIVRQTREAIRTNKTTCICGVKKKIIYMYKCFYCGIHFCKKCAEEHFKQEAIKI